MSDKPILYYITTVIPFIVISVICIHFKSKKINAIIFVFLGIGSTLLGLEDNATGAIFLIYSFYIFHSFKSNIIIAGLTLIAIVVKFTFLDFTISQSVNMIIAYIYIFIIYYILIHPKKETGPEIICTELDKEDIEILQFLYEGLSIKEIADIEIADNVYLSPGAITKRIGRAKDTMNAKSREHLLAICRELGYLRLNVDKIT